ncbi:MAG TPA: response regulator [Pontibacter sp.]
MFKLKHILIVDDDQINSLFSRIILEDANVCQMVSICQSAVEALELLRSADNGETLFPDLILLDIHMPGLDGFDFLDQYYQLGYSKYHQALISLFSSSDDPEHLERIKQYNVVVGLIKKPLSMTTLHNLLEHHLSPPVNNLL